MLPANKNSGRDEKSQRELFLERIPKKSRGHYRDMRVEERPSIRLSRDVPPYYVEMLVPMDNHDAGVFGRNVVDTLVYPLPVFKAMYSEDGHDPFAYKTRSEGQRHERYTPDGMESWLDAGFCT